MSGFSASAVPAHPGLYRPLLPDLADDLEDAAMQARHRTVTEQVSVVLHRTGDVTDVRDAVLGHVDHHDDPANSSGSGAKVSARYDP